MTGRQSPANIATRVVFWFQMGPIWSRVFVVGALVWILAYGTATLTENPRLVPTVIFVGSFLVPVTFVCWAYERQRAKGLERDGRESVISGERLVAAFLISGVVGLAGAAFFESVVVPGLEFSFFPVVAGIEEVVKLALLWLMALNLPHYGRRDGMVLGAAVGFGFAAFESAGYAFGTIGPDSSIDFAKLLETQIVRGILTPVGHGLWTALLGGVLFAAARDRKLRLTPAVLGWCGIVVALHTGWNLSDSLAVRVAFAFTDSLPNRADILAGTIAQPTAEQELVYYLVGWALLIAWGILGLILVRLQWRGAATARWLTTPMG